MGEAKRRGDTPFKSTVPSDRHKKLYQAFAEFLKREAADVSAEEILAIAANVVGKIIAMQDHRTMTREVAMEIVIRNIEAGNAEAIAKTASASGRPN